MRKIANTLGTVLSVILIGIGGSGCLAATDEVDPMEDEVLDEPLGTESQALSTAVPFSTHLLDQGGNLAAAPAIGDFDGDGQLDLLAVTNDIYGWSWTGFNFAEILHKVRPIEAGNLSNPEAVAVKLNGDNALDFAYSGGYGAHELTVYVQVNGTLVLSHVQPGTWGAYADYMMAADTDGDGDLDLVQTLSSAVPYMVVHVNSGTATFTREWIDHLGVGANRRFTVGNFLQIGDPSDDTDDIVLQNGRIFRSSQTGLPVSYGTLTARTGTETTSDVESGDFDGDGDLDLAFLVNRPSPYDSEIRIFANLAGQGFSASYTAYSIATTGAQQLVAGDFDRDPGKDFVVTVKDAGGNYSYRLLRKTGATYTASPLSLMLPAGVSSLQEPHRIAAGDLNTDGVTDLAIGYRSYSITDDAVVAYVSNAFVQYNGHSYLFKANAPKDWVAASDDCLLAGGELVTVNNAAEEAWLHARENEISANQWWLGFNDRAVEGTFVWETGAAQPVPLYTNWSANEPNNSGEEDCAADNFYAAGVWNDIPCAWAKPYVCERFF